ncbi:MAG: calycin-like domain-containing protein [Prevotella sp.]
MKRLLTSLAVALMALTISATDYKDVLNVSIDGNAAVPSETTITVDKNADGSYKLALKNFILTLGTDAMPVGTIILDNVNATEKDGMVSLQTKQNIDIQEGDPDVSPWWLASTLKNVPINMAGEIRGDKFYTVINISFMSMTIKVVFGNGGYQIPNSDFELFHKATVKSGKDTYESDEPNSWHSFMSASGFLAGVVGKNTHTYISDDVRPGSTGKSSVKIVSALALGSIPANGTLTTGQLQAAGFSAEDPKNCAFLDMSNEAVDGNGDPFYTIINGKPDAVKFWTKFKQGTLADDKKDFIYATMSAALTDGTRYQEPMDKEYTNVAARAQNATIESNDFAWQELTVPFDYATYAEKNVQAKAIFVTISTNAQPGVGAIKGSPEPDQIFVDDFELIYNSQLASLKVKGSDVEGFDKDTYEYTINGEGSVEASDIDAVSDGQGAYVSKTIEAVEGGVKATVTVTSNDLKDTNVYTINVKGATTGISKTETIAGNSAVKIYNVNGQRVNNTNAKGLYIIRKADGKTVKVLKK